MLASEECYGNAEAAGQGKKDERCWWLRCRMADSVPGDVRLEDILGGKEVIVKYLR